MTYRRLARWIALVLIGGATAVMTSGPAAAHTVSVGYVVTGPGSVAFYYGSYHSGVGHTEGSLQLSGPVNRTSAFTILTTTKPAGLVDGTNNFYSNGTALVGTNPSPFLAPTTWQGVAFTGLPDGSYTFTYVPIASPSADWAPIDNVIRTSTLTISTGLAATSTKRTVEVVAGFMSRRNDLIAGIGPDTNRLMERLQEASSRRTANSSGFASANDQANPGSSPNRLGANRLDGQPPGGVPADVARSTTNALNARGDCRSLIDRLTSGSGGARNGLGMNDPASCGPVAGVGDGHSPLPGRFATSLSEILRLNAAANDRRQQSVTAEAEGLSLARGQARQQPLAFLPYDLWIQGQYQSFRDSRDARNSEGFFGAIAGGADYIVNPGLLVGAYVAYDTMRQRSDVSAYNINGRGWMAGPYATLSLADKIYLSARVAAGRTTNSVSPWLTFTDEFNTRRWLASSTLSGTWQFGSWKVRPSATIAYVEDKSDMFTGGEGAIPGMKVSLGQFKSGPEISYFHLLPSRMGLETWISPQAIWNFSAHDPVADLGGTLTGPQGVRGRIDMGLRLHTTQGLMVDASVGYDGLGSGNYSAIGARLGLNMPLK